ncbi:hypothetical protein EHRUM3_10500 [Ehrlichia ruminantium]|uniref:Uncharacterized protein n=1 Tax=Ehrlichia ruminantium TaxID=779 RepID=A0A170TEZ8_EHRRU|nr:hypothetical protein EHRUM3_10500 [Ehrlichia ruminantium]
MGLVGTHFGDFVGILFILILAVMLDMCIIENGKFYFILL